MLAVLLTVLAGCAEPGLSTDSSEVGSDDVGTDQRADDVARDTGSPDGGFDAEDHDSDAADPRPDVPDPDRDAGEPDASPDARDAPDATGPDEPPTFEQFDGVIDLARGDLSAWAYLIHVSGDDPTFHGFGYGDTALRADYWPASTIKIYPVTAALVLLAEEGFSLDAEATFSHDAGSGFVTDLTMSFREMIFQTFTCSSNETYTLLLRFAGADWINPFLADHGFAHTALMRGYNSSRPWAYQLGERQRIVVREGDREFTREHGWGGQRYANDVGCTVYNASGTGNCSATADMAEHMRRVMFHEQLPDEERFAVRDEDLDWVRFGGPDPVMNNKEACGGPGWDGVREVFPAADFYHKGGLVTEYRLDVMYVEDVGSGQRYILAAAVNNGVDRPIAEISEAVARMVKTPDRFVWLHNLRDNVNPVVGGLRVFSEEGGRLELWVKDYSEDGYDRQGWTALPGSSTTVPVGWSDHEIRTECLDWSGQVHIRGRLWNDGDAAEDFAESDLHYVIVDAGVPCP